MMIIIYIKLHMKLEMKIKSNGHQVCTKLVKKQSISNEVTYYIDKFKLPISISISQIRSLQQESQLGKKTSIESANSYRSSEEDYDISVLSQQVILFESDRQIQEYISTQKLLAHDVQDKLSKLCKALILVANEQFQKKRSLISMSQIGEKVEEKNITKEQLNEIEQKCMQTLAKVQEERRKLDLCVICWQNMSNSIIIPCMHLVMCNKCPKTRLCPVCKTTVQSTAVVFR